MAKYKIHIDKPLPSKDEIAKHKDFKRLYGQYETATRFHFWRELRTNPRYFATLVMIIAVGLLVYDATMEEKRLETPCVYAPLSVDVPFTQLIIPDPSTKTDTYPPTDEVYQFVNPIRIKLPAHAFVDSAGNVVSDPITLKFRELRNPADFFIAGIPMNLGDPSLLESEGMMEIRAYQDSQSVFLQKGVQLIVSHGLLSAEGSYHAYYLDENERKWILYPQSPDLIKESSDSDTNTFQFPQLHIHQLGIYALGKERALPTASRHIRLKAEGRKPITSAASPYQMGPFVMMKGVNTLVYCPLDGDRHTLRFEPSQVQAIWAVTKDHRLAVLRIADVEKMLGDEELKATSLEMVEPFSDVQSLRGFLNGTWDRPVTK